MLWIASPRRLFVVLTALCAIALLGAAGAGMAQWGPVGAGFLGLGAGALAGGLLAYAIGRAAERPTGTRALGVTFLPRAVLLLVAFLWARTLWPYDAVWILPGYLAGEAVWVAHAIVDLRRRDLERAAESSRAEE